MFKTSKKSNVELITFLSFGLLLFICVCPEVCLASGLEGQLDKIGNLANGKLKTIGITAATICVAILAIARGNIKLMFLIIGIGICFSLYLEWIAGGMKFAV